MDIVFLFLHMVDFKLRAKRPVWKLRNDPIQNLSVCMCVCVCVCLSVCPSVFYLLDHCRDRNETFRGRRHQPFDSYYILKTYCYVNFWVICEKPVSRLILVAHIHTYVALKTLWPTSYLLPSISYLLPPTSYFLSPTSHLPPLFLPPTSLAISYLLPTFLSPTSLLSPSLPLTSYLSFYLLPPFLPPTSYLPLYLLPNFYLLPPFLLPISYLPFYVLFLPHTT